MGKRAIFVILILAVVWIILVEEISWQNLSVGLLVSIFSVYAFSRLFPYDEIKHVNFIKLATYPLWLIRRIYMDAFFLIRMIIGDAKCGVIKEPMHIESDALRFILSDSITLTPGSIFLDMEDDNIKLLCIGKRNVEGFPDVVGSLRAIEEFLKIAEPHKKDEKYENDENYGNEDGEKQ